MYIVENGRVYLKDKNTKTYYSDTTALDGEYINCPDLIVQEVIPLDIEILSANKKAEINQAAELEKSQGFDSDALGEMNHYYNHDKFPQWYRDYATVQNSAARKDTVDWMVGAEMVEHTAEQFDKVFSDLIDFERPIEYKILALLTQVDMLTTVEELDAIVW